METEPADLELRLQRDTTCVSGVGENCAAKLPAIAMSLRKFMKEVPATIWQHKNTLIRNLTYGHRYSCQCKDGKVAAIARIIQIPHTEPPRSRRVARISHLGTFWGVWHDTRG